MKLATGKTAGIGKSVNRSHIGDPATLGAAGMAAYDTIVAVPCPIGGLLIHSP